MITVAEDTKRGTITITRYMYFQPEIYQSLATATWTIEEKFKDPCIGITLSPQHYKQDTDV